MSNAAADRSFVLRDEIDPAVPGEPWSHLRFHYGQLLGEEDFRSEQSTRWLRHRLHLALFHGTGVAFGLELSARSSESEIGVCPGLAVDALGREIYVDREQCLRIEGLDKTDFWSQLAEAPRDPEDDAGDDVRPPAARRAYAVLRYAACLGDRVPAVARPCGGEDEAWVYGRLYESFHIELVAEAPPDPHELVRQWLLADSRVEKDAWQSLRDELQALLGDPHCADDQEERGHAENPLPLEARWRRFQEAPVLLGSVDLAPTGVDDDVGLRVAAINSSLRALLPPVQMVAEELLGQRLTGPDRREPVKVRSIELRSEEEPIDGGARTVGEVRFTRPLERLTITARSVVLHRLEDDGWDHMDLDIEPPEADAPEVLRFSVRGNAWPEDTVYQLVLAGDSKRPILGDNDQPLAGWWNEPVPDRGRGRNVSYVGTILSNE